MSETTARDPVPACGPFLYAVTTQGGTLHTSDRLLELRRVRIRGTTTLNEFGWLVAEWRGERH